MKEVQANASNPQLTELCEKLRQLRELFEEDVLEWDEFVGKKGQLLEAFLSAHPGASAATEIPAQDLRALRALYDDDVIELDEFSSLKSVLLGI